MKPKVMFLALAIGISSATLAEAKTYRCDFKQSGPGTTIPEVVIIKHNEGTGQVTVQDPFINHYVGAPLPGSLRSMNSTRIWFQWDLPSLKDSDGDWIPGIRFSVNIIRAGGKASISSNPSGNYEATRGSGSCSIR